MMHFPFLNNLTQLVLCTERYNKLTCVLKVVALIKAMPIGSLISGADIILSRIYSVCTSP